MRLWDDTRLVDFRPGAPVQLRTNRKIFGFVRSFPFRDNGTHYVLVDWLVDGYAQNIRVDRTRVVSALHVLASADY